MELIFLGFVIFLFMLAAFDLWVGVSNDAVNFLNSALGSKAARFRTIIIIAAAGIFIGATVSNGMMDIARHGMFNPEHFSFKDVMYIYLAVMVADIILLDVFNTMGMPTSTTVSMVFELLGASFAFSILQIVGNEGPDLALSDYMNSSKALSVIMAIFVSVAIAFFFGLLIQFIARLIFTFHFKKNLTWKIGIFGGIAATSIVYFMLIKGIKGLSFMTEELTLWIDENAGLIVAGCLVFFTALMQLLHFMKVNVLKVVVLMGTFALATAFASNDLVNFIGVPLSGFSAYNDYMSSGSTSPDTFMMDSLNESASTPVGFLFAAGVVMVVALVFSKKAHNVTKTELSLAKQEAGEEMFGSSRPARSIVRICSAIASFIVRNTPLKVRIWVDRRFETTQVDIEEGASYDLVRASVNLVVASLLIALGTSLKLPLSTTYVTFMVAMGSSLSDRAWGRESAVFRVTGVLSVIGGWFFTAGAAFTICFLIALAMYYGGNIAAIVIVLVSILVLVRSNIKYGNKEKKINESDKIFNEIASMSKYSPEIWPLLVKHTMMNEDDFIGKISDAYRNVTDGMLQENLKPIRKAELYLKKEKYWLKNVRRKEVMALRMAEPIVVMEKGAWFHTLHNEMDQMFYSVKRMAEPVSEHVSNNFSPLPPGYASEFTEQRNKVLDLIGEVRVSLNERKCSDDDPLRAKCAAMQKTFSLLRKSLMVDIHRNNVNLTMAYLYLNMLQESEQIVVQLKHMLRCSEKFYAE